MTGPGCDARRPVRLTVTGPRPSGPCGRKVCVCGGEEVRQEGGEVFARGKLVKSHGSPNIVKGTR